MSDKQIANAIGSHDAATMEFNRLLLREPVHNEEFIEGIAQRGWNLFLTDQALLTHLNDTVPKAAVHKKSLVWSTPEQRSGEVKTVSVTLSVKTPRRTRIEETRSPFGRKSGYPFNLQSEVEGA